MSPFFSVIFSVNQQTPFLKSAIDSVLTQTYSNFEFLICADSLPGDPGHGEKLAEHLKAICGGDARVRIYAATIPQLNYCLNFLIDKASGMYLVRMDADDISVPERFAVLADEIKKTNPDVIGSWATIIDDADREIGIFEPPTDQRGIERRMLFATAIYHPSTAIRREFFLRMRGYAGGLFAEDLDFWLRSLRVGARFVNVPQHLLRYRTHRGQMSASRAASADIAGYRLREFCLKPDILRLAALLVILIKLAIGPKATRWLRGALLGKPGATIEDL